MGKILVSVSLLGASLNDALEHNVDLLCQEFNLKMPEVISGLIKTTSRDEINTYLNETFPGQIKIVD